MNKSLSNIELLFLIFSLISYTSPVYAYIDPGTGSMLVQALIGGVAVVMSFLSIYWQKVKEFFSKEETEKETETETDTVDQD